MTPEEHQGRHIELHRMLDELLSCWLEESFARVDAGEIPQRASIHDPLLSLLSWSHEKTFRPSSAERHEYTRPTPAIANADVELFPWLVAAQSRAGGFLSTIADAALRADPENYRLIRYVLLALKAKYPQYAEMKLLGVPGFDGI